MPTQSPEQCCARFDPEPWDDKELHWQDKLFVKDHVVSFLHIPLNFGAVMKRNVARMAAADAEPGNMVVLSDENSLWGADLYLEASRDVPGAEMTTISGVFLSRVFEGPYRNVRRWIDEMKALGLSSEGLVGMSPGPTTVPLGGELLGEVLSRAPDVTAVFCCNDDLALGALFECHRRGIRVPDDLSIIGFNDLA